MTLSVWKLIIAIGGTTSLICSIFMIISILRRRLHLKKGTRYFFFIYVVNSNSLVMYISIADMIAGMGQSLGYFWLLSTPVPGLVCKIQGLLQLN